MNQFTEKIIIALGVTATFFLTVYSGQLPVFMGEFNSIDGSLYITRSVDIIITLLVIYSVSYLIIPRYLPRQSFGLILIWTGIVFLSACLIEYQLDRSTLKLFNLPTGPDEFSDKLLKYRHRKSFDLHPAAGNSVVTVFSLLFGLSRDWVKNYQNRNQLMKEKLKADIAFLKSQVNPHFFFNSLNNIFAITSRNKDREAGEAILKLSGMMRYMIYESDADMVPISKEVDLLTNYIDVAKLKYKSDDPLKLVFEQRVKDDSLLIAPLILLPFVENAFKHGINSKGQGSIEIDIEADSSRLALFVTNSIHPAAGDFIRRPGIGLENVRRRLSMTYGENHDLSIEHDENHFSVNLQIELDH